MSHQSEPAASAVTLDSRPDITHVKAILNGGTTVALSQKPLGNTGRPSQCAFFGELTDGPFSVTLRLDWSEEAIDANGDPTLDADVKKNGKKYGVGREKWHHTPKGLKAVSGSTTLNLGTSNWCSRSRLPVNEIRKESL